MHTQLEPPMTQFSTDWNFILRDSCCTFISCKLQQPNTSLQGISKLYQIKSPYTFLLSKQIWKDFWHCRTLKTSTAHRGRDSIFESCTPRWSSMPHLSLGLWPYQTSAKLNCIYSVSQSCTPKSELSCLCPQNVGCQIIKQKQISLRTQGNCYGRLDSHVNWLGLSLKNIQQM